ncbi:hypothetical protein J4Q44_G00055600 [Coregonus suidteri]|uniref:Uncharacterized protein n=1 Tax=Coregonus suidteri TaxID=861788 RepID=A0AAN8NAA6_9TELE
MFSLLPICFQHLNRTVTDRDVMSIRYQSSTLGRRQWSPVGSNELETPNGLPLHCITVQMCVEAQRRQRLDVRTGLDGTPRYGGGLQRVGSPHPAQHSTAG